MTGSHTKKKEKITPLRAVLFDMDGVLYDSEAWVQAMHRHGLSMTDEQVYMNEGRTGEGTIDIFTLEQWGREATAEEVEAIYRTKSDIFNEMDEVPPMPGADEVLAEVKGQGLLPVIVTGSGQRSLLERLDRTYPGYFCSERMVTAYDQAQSGALSQGAGESGSGARKGACPEARRSARRGECAARCAGRKSCRHPRDGGQHGTSARQRAARGRRRLGVARHARSGGLV